jgi:hypothetical protein
MKVVKPDSTDKVYLKGRGATRQRYRHRETASQPTEWLVVPPGLGDPLLRLELGTASSARIEYTQDDMAAVIAGTAQGTPWALGNVTEATARVMENNVTAIRMVPLGGTATFTVTV